MNTMMLENEIIQQLHDMPHDSLKEVLNFTLFIKQRLQVGKQSGNQVVDESNGVTPNTMTARQSRVGMLAGEKLEMVDFEMSDEELLQS